MGIQAMQPRNITYSVLGPSIDFMLGGEGEGGRDRQSCTQWCSLDLSLKPSLKRRENQRTTTVNKYAALLQVACFSPGWLSYLISDCHVCYLDL